MGGYTVSFEQQIDGGNDGFNAIRSGGKRVLMLSKPLGIPWNDGTKMLCRTLLENWPGGSPGFAAIVNRSGAIHTRNVDSEVICNDRIRQIGSGMVYNVWIWMKLMLARDRWDGIHALTTPVPTTHLAIRTLRRHSKKCVTIHTVTHCPRTLQGIAWDHADQIVAVSKRSQERLAEAAHRPVHLIYPGVQEQPEARSGSISSGNIRILYPGDLSFADSEYMLVRGLDPILEKFPGIEVIIACRKKKFKDRSVENRLRRQFSRWNHRVRFDGQVGNMPDLIANSDLVVFPAVSMHAKMDIPLVLIESMMAGKPIIVADTGALPELVAFENGISIGKDRPDSFTEAVEYLLQNDETRLSMGRKGRSAAVAAFSVRPMVTAYQNLYRESGLE